MPVRMNYGANRCSRRTFVQRALGAAALTSTPLLDACSRGAYIDVLAPPSTLRPDFVRLFRAQTGIEVRPGSWVSPTDALGKLFSASARFDLMIALSDLFTPVVPEAIARGLLRPLDPAQIPNARDLSPQFRSDMFAADGRIFTVPIYWGIDTVLYNRANVPASEPLVDSWGLIFDDKFKGKVSLKDDAHESIVPTALYMGHPRPLEMDRSDLREVTRFLIAKKANFRALWSKFAEAVQLLATGEVNALYGYPLMQHTLRHQGMDVGVSHPREGLLVFVQSAFIPSRAAHPEAALQWLNFLLREDIARQLTEQAAVLSPWERVRSALSAAQQHALGYGVLTGGVPLVRLGRPTHLDLWLEAWAEFKAA